MRNAVATAVAVFVLAVAIAGLATVASEHSSDHTRSTLAERINAACKPGYALSDWTTGDEYTPVPAGTVKVTCVRIKAPFDLYAVAVQR